MDRADVAAKLLDFETFAPNLLRVAPAGGGARVPFVINPPQRALHRKLEDELKHFSMIRALVPKARKMGVSTYIAARFFHKTTTQPGRRTAVIAHQGDASANLFAMVKEYYRDLPPGLAPSIAASNARELVFRQLRSLYKVMSAKGEEVGRSDTFQLMHLSEAAFFDDAASISAGLMRTVPQEPGTEIITESTGNGQSGMFYSMCRQAHAEGNRGELRVHFLPWTLMLEYATPEFRIPHDWTPPREFLEYARIFGLTKGQCHWFWVQNYGIATMNGGTPDQIHRITRQEFPVILDECFLADSTFDFFPPSAVQSAMARRPTLEAHAPKILAVDAAGEGDDPCFVGDRQGSVMGAKVWGELKTSDQNTQADWIIGAVQRFGFDAVAVDATGLGIGLVNALRLRMPQNCQLLPVIFSTSASKPMQYGNKRAEIIDRYRIWTSSETAERCMPNDPKLAEENAAFKWGSGHCHRDDKGKLWVTKKEVIKKAIGRSCDRVDTAALTFAIDDSALVRR